MPLGGLGIVFLLPRADNVSKLDVSRRSVDETSTPAQNVVAIGISNGSKAHRRHFQHWTVVGGGFTGADTSCFLLAAVGRPQRLDHEGSRLASLAFSTRHQKLVCSLCFACLVRSDVVLIYVFSELVTGWDACVGNFYSDRIMDQSCPGLPSTYQQNLI